MDELKKLFELYHLNRWRCWLSSFFLLL